MMDTSAACESLQKVVIGVKLLLNSCFFFSANTENLQLVKACKSLQKVIRLPGTNTQQYTPKGTRKNVTLSTGSSIEYGLRR